MLLVLLLAGIALLVAPLPGILGALSSGVIVRKGHGSVRISRAEEPERFRKLLNQRIATMIPGAIIVGVLLLLILAGLFGGAAQG